MPLPSVKSHVAAKLIAWLAGSQTEAPLFVDADGNLQVTLGGTNASLPLPDPWQVAATKETLVKEFVVKSSPGRLRSLQLRLDVNAPPGAYYVQILNATAAPPDGPLGESLLVGPEKLSHGVGVDNKYTADFLEDGLVFSTGCVVLVSLDEFAKTSADGDYLNITARYL